MVNQEKYILELETKLTEYQEKEKKWELEQQASIQVFSEKEKEITHLNKLLDNYTSQQEKDKQKIAELTNQYNETLKELKEVKNNSQTIIKEAEKYYSALQESKKIIQQKENLLVETYKLLETQQEKYKMLEEKFGELEGDPDKVLEVNSLEENIELRKTIQKLDKELENTRKNNWFLNRELEKTKNKDMVIDRLKSDNSQLEKELKKEQEPKVAVIYFCDICQTTKNSKVDGEVFEIRLSINPNVISSVCPNCRPNVVAAPDDDWNSSW